MKEELYLIQMFLAVAKAFLSMQVSSALVDRLFGDAGYQEGLRCQSVDDATLEMYFDVQGLVKARMQRFCARTGLITSRTAEIRQLMHEIAVMLYDGSTPP